MPLLLNANSLGLVLNVSRIPRFTCARAMLMATRTAGPSPLAVFNRAYTYDYLSRLASLSSPNDPSGCTGYSWTYDILGNRTAQTPTGGTNCMMSNLTYNNKNQIT